MCVTPSRQFGFLPVSFSLLYALHQPALSHATLHAPLGFGFCQSSQSICPIGTNLHKEGIRYGTQRRGMRWQRRRRRRERAAGVSVPFLMDARDGRKHWHAAPACPPARSGPAHIVPCDRCRRRDAVGRKRRCCHRDHIKHTIKCRGRQGRHWHWRGTPTPTVTMRTMMGQV